MERKLITFSEYYGIIKEQEELEFVDIFLNDDLKVFIDPGQFMRYNDPFSIKCHNTVVDFFSKLIMTIKDDERSLALKMLNALKEPKETHLGYSSNSVSGKGIGNQKAILLYNNLRNSRAVKNGVLKNLEDSALLVRGVGIDCISDITTNIIREHLMEFTQIVCKKYDIPIMYIECGYIWNEQKNEWIALKGELPVFEGKPILLVPKRLVTRDLFVSPTEFYNHDILEFIQERLMTTNENMVRVLKNGKRECVMTKKDLKSNADYKFSKELLYQYIHENPMLFAKYRGRIKYKSINHDNIIAEAVLEKTDEK